LVASTTTHEITKYKEALITPLQSTKNKDLREEITSRIGPLGKPSKMPGYAWGISSKHCITGSKLALIEGTPCSICYALRQRYKFPSVVNAQSRRFRGWMEDKDWKGLMAIAIRLTNKPFFRWFDSGDLQSVKMLEDIVWLAKETPTVNFWLPTQERTMVKEVNADIRNLTIRVSHTKLNVTINQGLSSSVGDTVDESGVHVCPSQQQNNKCGTCRACWDKNVNHVRYLAH
jgi:hypothetical protein